MYLKKFDIEIKSIQEDEGIVTFYGAVFGNRDCFDDVIEKGAFSKTLQEKKIEDFKFLFQHNKEKILGKFLSIKEDDYGLLCEAKFFLDTAEGKEKFLLVKEKQLKGFSIGYIPTRYEIVKSLETKEYTRYLKEIDLFEVSLVSNPANNKALLLSYKGIDTLLNEGNIIIADKETKFDEEEEKEKISHCLGIEDFRQYKIGGKLVFCYNKGQLMLNFKAVDNLSNEIKANNPIIISQLYQKFREEFKDNTLFSNVCNKTEIIKNSWTIKDYDKLLEHNGYRCGESKAFFDKLAEIKKSEFTDTIKELEQKNKDLEEQIRNLKERNIVNVNELDLIEGIDY